MNQPADDVGRGAAIRFDGVVKEYAGGVRAVDGVSFEIPSGAFAVLLGPSGCGKTTLLKTVNRLIEPSAGTILIDGTDTSSLDGVLLRRGIGYVIQQIGLFPHMSVAANVACVPQLLGWPQARIDERVDELLALVNLDPAQYRERFPRQLSGGQQQRVGLARALAADPELLLMDEPFGAIDAIERARLQAEVARLHSRLRKTIVFVTHDVDEALRLAHIIVVMREGKVAQIAAPLEVLAKPADDFVGALVGAGDVVRRFGLIKVSELLAAFARPPASTGATVAAEDTLRSALSKMLVQGVDALVVLDGANNAVGTLTLDDLRAAARSAA